MSILYNYEGLNAQGGKLSGELKARSRAEALRDLQHKGVRPTQLAEQKKGGSKNKSKSVAKASNAAKSSKVTADVGIVLLKKKDVIVFTEELSELLGAGLPLEPALASMAQRDEDGVLKATAENLRALVTDGIPMHIALRKVSKHFDALYCNLVAAGEVSGTLKSILQQHGVYLKQQSELRGRLTMAMVYPGFLLVACIGMTLLFLFYLLPQITELLSSMKNQNLPLGIRLATNFGDFLRAYWVHIMVLICMIVLVLKVMFGREENKARWDTIKLKLPFIGNVVQYSFFVQWLQTLGNLLHNGVPLVQGLELTSETISNRFLKDKLSGLTDKVKDGYTLTSAMRLMEVFPTNMLDLVAVGETTGKLSRAVLRTAEYYDKRLSTLLSAVVTIISPIILIGMAIIVATLCYTMVQAIYQTINSIHN